jgi:hypothetical protein
MLLQNSASDIVERCGGGGAIRGSEGGISSLEVLYQGLRGSGARGRVLRSVVTGGWFAFVCVSPSSVKFRRKLPND